MNSQLQPVCYAKVRGLLGKNGTLRLVRLQSRCWSGLQPSQRPEHLLPSSYSYLANLKRSSSKLIPEIAGRPLYLSLHPDCPLNIAAGNGRMRQGEGEREHQKVSQNRASLLYPNLEVPSDPICHFLFIRSKSLGQVHTQGEENT